MKDPENEGVVLDEDLPAGFDPDDLDDEIFPDGMDPAADLLGEDDGV